ncbi:MAG: T9SS type A sorting domain-containing protein [Bacteroidales bacterium]|nr:T9SS type A sorting domain-containing protein [Bacteroidales bacterium]
MRKLFLSFVLVMLSFVTFGQQWVAIKSDAPSTMQTSLVSSSESQITVKVQVPGFYAIEVSTPRGEANIISVPKAVSTTQAGEPNLPMIAIPAIVGDAQHYSIRVVDAQYADYPMEVAPSKGDFPRTINPADVPYTYGKAYAHDAFFPAQNVGLYEPYIMRDFRGQNMVVYPFAYNPVSKTLRVYYNMTIEMFADGQQGENVINRRSTTVKMDPEIKAMYERQFINFGEGLSKYTPMDETGHLLIICHDAFMSAMQPFVNWKKQIGRPTMMVGTSTSGTTAAAIKSYIESQYASDPNLTHVLLVGDVAQIPGNTFSAGSYGGKSDNMYGQVVGNDLYNDIIVGRFSAENEAHVTTQVNKVIHYERDIAASDTWLPTGTGVATVAGGGGHFGEDDWQHIDNIRTDLLDYNYTEVYRDYPSGGGANSNSATLSQHINNGVSIINYCNHGSETSWGVFNYSNSNVNALTNTNKLPIVWSVACLNGKYDHSQPCFGETWLRANDNNDPAQPTGAIGGMFSYISQPWIPPMYGQDEMVDVLVESYNNNIKRTLGGTSFDGNLKILDQYGQNDNAAKGTYLAWILYGDPTLTLRNTVPENMNVTHASSMSTTATSFTVNATNGNGALATLTRNNEIMGSATINNGTANITFTAPGTTGTATLTVFGYNKITYIATIQITSGGTQSYTINVSANPANGGTVTGGGTYQEGQSCTVSATPNAGYTFVNWTENGTVVSSNANYSFTVNGNRNLVAHFNQQYTITVSANPTNGGTVIGGGTYQQGWSVTVSAIANAGYTFTNWTENGNVVSTNTSFSFVVNSNRTLVANFQLQSYTISATADPTNGGTIAGTGTYNYGQNCTLTATPTSGFQFENWTLMGMPVSSDPSYTFTVTQNAAFIAHFQAMSFTVEATANPTEGGTITGSGTYNYEETCTVNAAANEGYNFINWTENGFQVSTNPNYTFNVTANRNLAANFELQSFEVKVTIDPVEAGTVTGEGTYNYGDEVTLILNRNEDWAFQNWTENGEVISEEMIYTFIITADRTLVANFMHTESLNEVSANVKLYPNPTQGELTLEGEGIQCIRIVNVFGQTVYNAKVEGEQVRLDISSFAKGIYMMHIGTANGEAVKKITVE